MNKKELQAIAQAAAKKIKTEADLNACACQPVPAPISSNLPLYGNACRANSSSKRRIDSKCCNDSCAHKNLVVLRRNLDRALPREVPTLGPTQ